MSVKDIFGQNKRSVVAASSSSYVNIEGVNYEGIFKAGVASNVLAVTAVRVTGYGFVPTLSKYLGFGSISNVYAHNTGAVVLLGDNATYWDIEQLFRGYYLQQRDLHIIRAVGQHSQQRVQEGWRYRD